MAKAIKNIRLLALPVMRVAPCIGQGRGFGTSVVLVVVRGDTLLIRIVRIAWMGFTEYRARIANILEISCGSARYKKD